MTEKEIMEMKITQDDLRRVREMANFIQGTLSQVGDNEVGDDENAPLYSEAAEQLEAFHNLEYDPIKFAEKTLFVAYCWARKLAEKR